MIELPIAAKPDERRWILFGAQNRFFIGKFDGKTFTKESGPHGGPRGVLYAAQLFSNIPDGRGIQIGWIRNQALTSRSHDRMVSQSFTLPQELLLQETSEGLRVLLQPVKEVENLRGSQILVDRCSSHGLGGFYVTTLNAAATLTAVLNCNFEGKGSIMPHMHWSTAQLVDSCKLPGGRIDCLNRHSSGSARQLADRHRVQHLTQRHDVERRNESEVGRQSMARSPRDPQPALGGW